MTRLMDLLQNPNIVGNTILGGGGQRLNGGRELIGRGWDGVPGHFCNDEHFFSAQFPLPGDDLAWHRPIVSVDKPPAEKLAGDSRLAYAGGGKCFLYPLCEPMSVHADTNTEILTIKLLVKSLQKFLA